VLMHKHYGVLAEEEVISFDFSSLVLFLGARDFYLLTKH